MSKINDNIKDSASKLIFDNKMVDTIKSALKKVDVYVTIFGKLSILGVDTGSIKEDIKNIKDSTEHLLGELSKLQEKSIEEKKKDE